MKASVRWHVFGVVVLGGLCSALVYVAEPDVSRGAANAALILGAFALVAEALALVLPNSSSGSLGFIPYLAAILISPNWVAIAVTVGVRIAVDAGAKRKLIWWVFNVGQHAATVAIATLVYRALGGESIFLNSKATLSALTIANGLPAVIAFATSFVINATLVSSTLAAKDDRSFREIWRDSLLATIFIDILASPIVFLFAWVFVAWGPFAAAALWVPVLGLRYLQKINLNLQKTNNELLELMVKSMEARDPYTSGHSRRVQQFSTAIARGLGLPPGEIDKVSRGALLHDVGKIYDKYAPILRKPGKLAADEWQTMQQHPADGAALVSTMSHLRDIVPSIRHHHERWDGTGYPDGLAGESIPLPSRIIAFADTIDAMISERPYRRTMTETDVRAEIVRCRGTQFDPKITDKVLSAAVWRLLFAPEQDVVAAKAGLSLFTSAERAAKRA